MAGRKENLKSLFTNTRTRVIVIFTAILLITAVVIGVVKLKSTGGLGNGVSSNVSNVPGQIQSIPGALNPTVQYAKLQEAQNVNQASSALQSGGSAIPTIVRTQEIGAGVQPIDQPPSGQGGVGFATLAREDLSGTQRGSWIQALQNSSCSKATMVSVVGEGATLTDLKAACTCVQLKDNGYQLGDLQHVCSCKELRAAGFNARQLQEIGFSAARLRLCGFDACELRNAGFSAQQMKDGNFSDGELRGAGFPESDIAKASSLPNGLTEDAVRQAGCQVDALKRLRAEGVSAASIRRISGCSAGQLKAAGYSASDLRDAGFSAADLKNAGFTPQELSQAGINTATVGAAGKATDCSVASLQAARAAGVSATTVKQNLGCSAAALKAAGYTAKELRDAGFTAAELKNAGFSAADLKAAGFSAKELKDAGYSLADLKNAGFTASQLKDAGFSAADLRRAGFSAADLKAAGFSAKDLRDAGFSAQDLKNAGYSAQDLKNAGFSSEVAGLNAATAPGEIPSNVSPIPGIPGGVSAPANAIAAAQAANAKQLQNILRKQNEQLADQKYQQRIQQRISQMLGTANQSLSIWQKVSTQTYVAGSEPENKNKGLGNLAAGSSIPSAPGEEKTSNNATNNQGALIRTGDVLFAVLDTSVNSDEPGPILATVVSGKFKGAKLIGSFNLPTNAEKMVISFNTMTIPGAPRTTSISAYAIDPNTARTALSSKTDHHYLLRYGSLFASSFLEGFGNAFQSANTTVTIGGTGGGQNITVQNGIGRSALENAVIGLATLGKAWGQVAQQQFSTPTTVEVYSGTGLGILFTQDVTSLT